jgi:hypothetical protein
VRAQRIELLRGLMRRHAGTRIDDQAEPRQVIGVVGRLTGSLLRSIGIYDPLGDPRAAAPCLEVAVSGIPTVWLLESDVSALCVVAASQADAVERSIVSAGQLLAVARIGLTALAQYQLLERRRLVFPAG